MDIQEIKELVAIELYSGYGSPCKCDSCAKARNTANAIHALYLQEGYVQLTKDEAEILMRLLRKDYSEECDCLSCITYRAMLAKLKAVGEIK